MIVTESTEIPELLALINEAARAPPWISTALKQREARVSKQMYAATKHAEKVAAGAGPQAEQALDNLVKDAKPPSRP